MAEPLPQQAAVRTADRVVVQVGISLGDVAGCVIDPLAPETADALMSALATLAPGEALVLAEDQSQVAVRPPSAEWLTAAEAAEAAAVQLLADQQAVLAVMAGTTTPNPTAAAALARLLGLSAP